MIQIHNCEQGSREWHALRAGLPTASMFATILREGKDGGASKTRGAYLRQLAGEIITGEIVDGYTNGNMERGKAMEAEARELYAFQHDVEPTSVGFITNGRRGCSPDSLIGEPGALEVKTKQPTQHLECLLRSTFPPEHKAQCQGVLLVSEREWIDLAVYWPKLPLITFRAFRDEPYIANLVAAIDTFNDELDALVERVRAFGRRPAAEHAA